MQLAGPWLLILTLQDGRKRLAVASEPTAEVSLQRRHIRAADRQNLELIDAAGNYFARVQGSVVGIDWGLYWRGGLFGPVALLLNLVFFWTVMVRIRLECAQPPTSLPLLEIKRKVRAAILSNPHAYTHASPNEIVGRVNVARTAASLITSIGRD